MTMEELKKAKLAAMKAREGDRVTAYNAILSKLTLMATDANHGKEITEADVVTAARKAESELVEERENFLKAGRAGTVASLDVQLETVRQYIPAMMSAEKIREIVSALPDKSLPAVMKFFKANYAGQCDMRTVNEVVRSL